MEINEVYDVLNQLADYPYQEIDLEIEGLKLHVKKTGATNLEVSTSESKVATSATVVKSPMVGIIHLDTPVMAGQTVQKGDVLAQIESMKLFNDLQAPKTGIVKRCLVEDGQGVEFEQPLFEIIEG
jgi:acetyl-CoA carboxylase biotin carboxyl carrier protein